MVLCFKNGSEISFSLTSNRMCEWLFFGFFICWMYFFIFLYYAVGKEHKVVLVVPLFLLIFMTIFLTNCIWYEIGYSRESAKIKAEHKREINDVFTG